MDLGDLEMILTIKPMVKTRNFNFAYHTKRNFRLKYLAGAGQNRFGRIGLKSHFDGKLRKSQTCPGAGSYDYDCYPVTHQTTQLLNRFWVVDANRLIGTVVDKNFIDLAKEYHYLNNYDCQ